MDSQIAAIMQVANDLNLPFCQMKLKSILSRSDATGLDSSQGSLVPTFMEAIKSSIDRGSSVWAQLIPVLDKTHTAQVGCFLALIRHSCQTDIKKLREMAEAELLSYLTSSTSAISPAWQQKVTALKGLLAIVDVTDDNGIPDASASQLLTHIVETLDCVLSTFSSATSKAHMSELEESASVVGQQQLDILYLKSVMCSFESQSDIDRPSIDVVLRLLIIHHCSFANLRSSQPNVARLLLTLSSLLIHGLLAHNAHLTTHIFDVLSLLTDSLTDDTRAACIRILSDQFKTRDPRLCFLFGYSEGIDDESLHLASTLYLSLSATTATTTTSDPKRGGMKTMTQQHFHLRRWEMMQEATPIVGENDTSLSLVLFGARKAVLQL